MTGLEAIAQRLEENKKQIIENILSISGSNVVSKNDYNITVVDETNPATSLLFKGLSKDKYDETELLKAVDVTVRELAPNIPSQNLDLVPKPLYDAEVETNAELRNEVSNLNLLIDDLTNKVTDLETQLQTEVNNRLSIEQTNDALTNQLDTVNSTITDFTGQISTSLQKSVDESILRASLQSQNTGFKAQIKALIKQIDSLNSIIEGLQAQLGAVQQQQALQGAAQSIAAASGADVINEVGLVNFTEKGNENDGFIFGAVNNAKYESKWKYGEYINISNTDTAPISVKIEPTFDSVGQWFSIPETQFVIEPGKNKVLQLVITGKSKSDGGGGRLDYKNRQKSSERIGKININITRADGSTKSRNYKTKLNLMHPKSYPGF